MALTTCFLHTSRGNQSGQSRVKQTGWCSNQWQLLRHARIGMRGSVVPDPTKPYSSAIVSLADPSMSITKQSLRHSVLPDLPECNSWICSKRFYCGCDYELGYGTHHLYPPVIIPNLYCSIAGTRIVFCCFMRPE